MQKMDQNLHVIAAGTRCGFTDCGGPAIFVLGVTGEIVSALSPGGTAGETATLTPARSGPCQLLETYPAQQSVEVKPEWPEVAKDLFPEIVNDLADPMRKVSPILSNCRTVLDTCLADLLQLQDFKSIGGRPNAIRALAKQGILTPTLEAWALRLWVDGSEAVHTGHGGRNLAQAYADYLKVFLRVVYELPGEIENLQRQEVEAGVLKG